MKILFVSSFLPYPLFSGGHIRLFNIIKHLSKKHKITLVCEKRDYQTKDDINAVGQFCKKVITVPRKKQWSWNNILKTGFSIYPFLLTGHRNVEMQKALKDLLQKEKFDLIHVETFYVMQNLPETKLPIILIEHNIEYLVYKRFLQSAPVFIRPFLYIDILKLKYWEEIYWEKATRLVAVSDAEKRLMKREDVSVVPNGVDVHKFKTQNSKLKTNREKRILFMGDFKWIQNVDAAQWILREIWPIIKSKVDLKLWVVGKNIPSNIKKLGDNSVIFDESASKETELIYQKANVLLAPIRVGGGTSFKILEAMASGVPVITTSLGNEGIGAHENEEILVAKDANDFANKIADVLEDKNLYNKIANNARKLIEEKYDWEKIVGSLEEVYKSAV